MPINGVNSINNFPVTAPVNNFQALQQQQPSVAVTMPDGNKQIYTYPKASVYSEPNKQSGINVYVFNPSGLSNNYGNLQGNQSFDKPIGNTPLSLEKTENEKPKKTKKIVKLTNDYIRTLESFLRSQDASVRKQGVQDLIKRFEEDNTRYDNPSLTALLNIALQDNDVHNRLLALSVIASGGAQGDENTIFLLNELKNSDKMYGQEAKMASNALLKTSQIKIDIQDNTPNNNDKMKNDIDKMYEMKS